MARNWHQPDWPNFSWDATRLRKAEDHFLVAPGILAGTLPRPDQDQLRIDAPQEAFHQPTLTALAATTLLRRRAYYAALEAANKSNEVTAWLSWFAGSVIEV